MQLDVEKLEHYFLEVFPNIISPDEALSLLYLVAGIKPGVLIMSAQNREIGPVKDFCDEFGFESRFFHSAEDIFNDKGLFIADKKDRFEILESSEGAFYGCSDIDVGEFLGYDIDAVKYYEENYRTGEEYREKLADMVGEEKISGDETDYLNLICYIPVPDRRHILKAVARGKKRARKLREFDKKHSTDIGEKYLQKMLEKETRQKKKP